MRWQCDDTWDRLVAYDQTKPDVLGGSGLERFRYERRSRLLRNGAIAHIIPERTDQRAAPMLTEP